MLPMLVPHDENQVAVVEHETVVKVLSGHFLDLPEALATLTHQAHRGLHKQVLIHSDITCEALRFLGNHLDLDCKLPTDDDLDRDLELLKGHTSPCLRFFDVERIVTLRENLAEHIRACGHM